MKALKYLLTTLLFPAIALAECEIIEFDNDSNIIRAKIIDTTDNQGYTGLTSASSGLRIAIISNNEATTTSYTSAGSTIEGITTLGTFATPTATKVRFKLVDDTNHPGLYEFQFDNARFSVANAKSLIISVSGVANMQEMDCYIPLVYSQSTLWANLLNTTAAELSALPGATPSIQQMLQYVYQILRFQIESTSTTQTLRKADSSTSLGSATVSDSAGTFTRGKFN